MRERFSFGGITHDIKGAALIEFALLAPIFLGMLIGVIQIGMQMQNYNAVRSIASEVARETVVQYQRGDNDIDNNIDNDVIREIAIARAVNAPYLLNADRIDVEVLDVATSRVSGARELSLNITYSPENFLGFLNIDALKINYSRPIFVPQTAVS